MQKRARRKPIRAVVLGLAICAFAACRSPQETKIGDPAGATHAVGWRTLGSWSGRGSLQTPSFETVTGQLRIRWRASSVPGTHDGSFELAAKSAISGRVLQVAVDRTGPGAGTAYVSQDPHDMYMDVDAANLDWSFTVEEAVGGTIEEVSPSGKR